VITHQSYRNPPLVLALLEIRHPTTDYLTKGDIASLKQELVKVTPLHKEENVTEYQFMIHPNAAPMTRPSSKVNHRFLKRDRQTSITFGTDFINVETTNYVHWTDIKKLAEAAIMARLKVSDIDGIERIGIRLVDEIRVPHDGEQPKWEQWVSPKLLAPDFSAEKLTQVQQQSVIQYAMSELGQTLTLSYGAVNGPPTVGSAENLIRATNPGPGHFFLLDTDVAWSPTNGQSVPEFETQYILNVADSLHEPMSTLFEQLITDKLRGEVLHRV
jgi:uncharacterized protein (TIGR04255 family)